MFIVKFLGMVDTVFADVAQPDQARIVALNANYFLKNGGHIVMSIKVRHFRLFFQLFRLNFVLLGKLHRFDRRTGSGVRW